jgi:CBS domain containing-hemolysin-like protein
VRLFPPVSSVVSVTPLCLSILDPFTSYLNLGPNQLQIAAFLAPVVKILMALFYIVARPIGLLLDAWLGTHDEDGKAPFNAKDLYTLLNLSRAGVINTPSHNVDHVERLSRAPSILSGDLSTPFLDDDAVLIAQGALLSSKKTVRSLVKSSYHSVHGDEKITLDWLEGIGHSGYSRICVTQPPPSTPTSTSSSSTIQQHLGYFVVKEILSDLKRYLSTSCTVKDLPIHPIYFFKETDSILVALNQFQNGHSRIAAVTKDGYPSSPMLGYFSMEDVVEAIIQEEISDEKDSRQYSKSLLQATKSPLLSSADRTATQENRPTVGGISLKEVNWMGKPDSQV